MLNRLNWAVLGITGLLFGLGQRLPTWHPTKKTPEYGLENALQSSRITRYNYKNVQDSAGGDVASGIFPTRSLNQKDPGRTPLPNSHPTLFGLDLKLGFSGRLPGHSLPQRT
ncbi:hypothetical protein G7K_2526-t1 [Saitoella complicata NRRL Y-17804]|uniref:Uncharacterized protein n=1 Tax=Saitoella complicata (strain BCRC 22490 / CBS 7301 / JCM 7358 / NBRC 10748 / NRRL Y-17804) TaxID=698492 RepID=A0A0E9NEU9_SAICN|nr:hypothetical protein G7K_2526-t1 [Saitoella complicata NRRL Y-17804]